MTRGETVSKTCKFIDPETEAVVAEATGDAANGSEVVARNGAVMQLLGDKADVSENDYLLRCE